MDNLKMPQREKAVYFKGINYNIEFGNSGQLIQFQIKKQKFSRNEYENLASSNDVYSNYTGLIIETISFFSACCPKLLNDIKVNSLEDLNLADTAELTNLYLTEIRTWIDEWMNFINETTKKINNELGVQKEEYENKNDKKKRKRI